MADLEKAKTSVEDEVVRTFRVTLTSTRCAQMETYCADFKRRGTENEVKIRGPVRMPTKKLRVTTRKAPCGEGTNTWDRFEMRIHKRIMDVTASHKQLLEMTEKCKRHSDPTALKIEFVIKA